MKPGCRGAARDTAAARSAAHTARCLRGSAAMPAPLRLGFVKAATAPGTAELKGYLPIVSDAALQGKRCRTPSISFPRSCKRRSAVRVLIPLKLTHFGRCSHETKAFDVGTRSGPCQPAPSRHPSVGPSSRSPRMGTAPHRHRTRLSARRPPARPRSPAAVAATAQHAARNSSRHRSGAPKEPPLSISPPLRPSERGRTLPLPVAGAGPDGKSRSAARPGNPSRGGAASVGGGGQPGPTWAASRRACCPLVPLPPAAALRSSVFAPQLCCASQGSSPGISPAVSSE